MTDFHAFTCIMIRPQETSIWKNHYWSRILVNILIQLFGSTGVNNLRNSILPSHPTPPFLPHLQSAPPPLHHTRTLFNALSSPFDRTILSSSLSLPFSSSSVSSSSSSSSPISFLSFSSSSFSLCPPLTPSRRPPPHMKTKKTTRTMQHSDCVSNDNFFFNSVLVYWRESVLRLIHFV